LASRFKKDLAQSALVGADSSGQLGRDLADELEALLSRSHIDNLHNDAQEFGQRNVGEAQLELARFDLGKIEDIVDQRQQLLTAVLDHVQPFDLALVKRLVPSNICA
jgi:nucleotidyltransferase/DNA polymerase involved in DNA repair